MFKSLRLFIGAMLWLAIRYRAVGVMFFGGLGFTFVPPLLGFDPEYWELFRLLWGVLLGALLGIGWVSVALMELAERYPRRFWWLQFILSE